MCFGNLHVVHTARLILAQQKIVKENISCMLLFQAAFSSRLCFDRMLKCRLLIVLLHLFVVLHNYHLFFSGKYANQELVQQLCSPWKKGYRTLMKTLL